MLKTEPATTASYSPPQPRVPELLKLIDEIRKDSRLYKEENFDGRADAIDLIEQAEIVPQNAKAPDQLLLLKQQAEKVTAALQEVNTSLFKKLRAKISSGGCTGQAFKKLIAGYTEISMGGTGCSGSTAYTNLDVFINGLCGFQAMPQQTLELQPEMVYYQKTPADVVFDLAEKIDLAPDDVFFDIGSGLGQVLILMHLLTGVTAKGIEFEPAFCNYAQHCAQQLNLPAVSFINTDARQADYTGGTVFFMFTPFTGGMMQDVLERLKQQALLRKITIITYGPCTSTITQQAWLRPGMPVGEDDYKVVVFGSR